MPVWLLYVTGVSALIYQVVFSETDIWQPLGGAVIGILFLFVSRITREGIGYGDSWGILILGVYLGIWELVEVLLTAFFILAVFSAVVLTGRKMTAKCRLPFYPFLAGGYLTVLFIEGGRL